MNILLSALVLTTALTSVACAGPGIPTAATRAKPQPPETVARTTLAAPIVLSESQLDRIAAGVGASAGAGGFDRPIVSAQGSKPAMAGEVED